MPAASPASASGGPAASPAAQAAPAAAKPSGPLKRINFTMSTGSPSASWFPFYMAQAHVITPDPIKRFPGDGIVVREETVQSDRETVARVVRATLFNVACRTTHLEP